MVIRAANFLKPTEELREKLQMAIVEAAITFDVLFGYARDAFGDGVATAILRPGVYVERASVRALMHATSPQLQSLLNREVRVFLLWFCASLRPFKLAVAALCVRCWRCHHGEERHGAQ